jgi:hypothetical protein
MAELIVLLILAYVVAHLVTGHSVHRYNRRRGRRLNYGWSLARGPWAGLRVFGGEYYHHV